MKKLAVIALLIGIGAVPALAQTTYDFTYTGGYFTATGSLDVNGSGLATSGSGTMTWDGGADTSAITLFPLNSVMEANPGSDGVRVNGGTDLNGLDNLVFPSSNPLLDGYGLIFWMGNTAPTAALLDTSSIHPNFGNVGGFAIGGDCAWACGGTYSSFGADGSLDLYASDLGTFTLTPAPSVPDGGTTLALLGFTIAGLAGLRRKFGI